MGSRASGKNECLAPEAGSEKNFRNGLAYCSAGVVVVNAEVVELASEHGS
jgi:hypothetical protein